MSALNVKGVREEALLKNFQAPERVMTPDRSPSPDPKPNQAEEDDLTSLLDEKKQNKHMHYAKYHATNLAPVRNPNLNPNDAQKLF